MLNKKGDVFWPIILAVILLLAFLIIYLFVLPSGKDFLVRTGDWIREVMRIGG
ncbi:MAG: hypothetical protein NTX24_04465 [Candidatus Pacearchaeota archaeon]|nr:hypothetical protein [Candidatus Pacearchaeota archaeon]